MNFFRDTSIGFGVMFTLVLLCMLGCGSVDALAVPDGGGEAAAGSGGAGGAAGTMGMGGSTGGSMAGAGGGAAGASGGATGAAGSAGLPLGAACTANSACSAPHICAADVNGGMACCDGHPDACNACVQGHLQPVADGTLCGSAPPPGTIICTGTYTMAPGNIEVYPSISANACTGGTCGPAVLSCASQVTCPSGLHPGCRVDILSSGPAKMEGAGCGCAMY